MLAPKIAELPAAAANAGVQACPLAQATPDMLRSTELVEGGRARVLTPTLEIAAGLENRRSRGQFQEFCRSVAEAAGGGDLARFDAAFGAGVERQREYQRGLWAIGERALDYAREHDLPVVMLVGNPHVLHEPALNVGIHEVIAENGALAVPVDCFPVPGDVPPLKRVYWSNANQILRASLAAARDGSAFPLLLLAYGCGPGSFTEHFFRDLLDGYPHTIIETDGHGGRAGYVTRVQAFLHSARHYRHHGDPSTDGRTERYERLPLHDLKELRDERIVVMTIGPKIRDHVAHTLRGRGWDAEFCGVTDPRALLRGRALSSG